MHGPHEVEFILGLLQWRGIGRGLDILFADAGADIAGGVLAAKDGAASYFDVAAGYLGGARSEDEGGDGADD